MAKHKLLASATACALLALSFFGHAQPVHALTMAECSTKYQAAKDSGKLGTMKWNDFRAKECAANDTAATPATAKPEAAKAAAKDEKDPPVPTTAPPKNMKFPKAVSSKYASETPGKGRMHTCLDAYNEAKDKDMLNGMKWIEKGGGYYSHCNAALKGTN